MGNNNSTTNTESVMSENQLGGDNISKFTMSENNGGYNNEHLSEVDLFSSDYMNKINSETDRRYQNLLSNKTNELLNYQSEGGDMSDTELFKHIITTYQNGGNNDDDNNISDNYQNGGNNDISDTEYFRNLFMAHNAIQSGSNHNTDTNALETIDLFSTENYGGLDVSQNYSATSPLNTEQRNFNNNQNGRGCGSDEKYNHDGGDLSENSILSSFINPNINNQNGGNLNNDNFDTNEFIQYLINTGSKLSGGGKDSKKKVSDNTEEDNDSDESDSDESDSDDEDSEIEDSDDEDKDDKIENKEDKKKNNKNSDKQVGSSIDSSDILTSSSLSISNSSISDSSINKSYNKKSKKQSPNVTETEQNLTETPYNLTSSINTSDINLVSFTKNK